MIVELGTDERIVAMFRKHWFLPAIHTATTTLLFIIPIALVLFIINHTFTTSLGELHFSFNNPPVIALFVGIWGLILWIGYFSFWTDHQLDGWVITNKRIIDIEQRGFFRRDISSFRLERLQDVKVEVHGIIATLLKFGEVHVQTAGVSREFVFENAPEPERIKEVILQEYNKIIETDTFRTDRDAVSSPN